MAALRSLKLTAEKITRADRWRNKVAKDIVTTRDKTEIFCTEADTVLSSLHTDLATYTDKAETDADDQRLILYINGFTDTCKTFEQNLDELKGLLDNFTTNVKRVDSLGLTGVSENLQHSKSDNQLSPRRSDLCSSLSSVDGTNPAGSLDSGVKSADEKVSDDINSGNKCASGTNNSEFIEDKHGNIIYIESDGDKPDTQIFTTYIVMKTQDTGLASIKQKARLLQEKLQEVAGGEPANKHPKRGAPPVSNDQLHPHKSDSEVASKINRILTKFHMKRSTSVQATPDVRAEGAASAAAGVQGQQDATKPNKVKKVTKKVAPPKKAPVKSNKNVNHSALPKKDGGKENVRILEDTKSADAIAATSSNHISCDEHVDAVPHEDADEETEDEGNAVDRATKLMDAISVDEMIRQDELQRERSELRRLGSKLPLLLPLDPERPWSEMTQNKQVIPRNHYQDCIPGPRGTKRKWLVTISNPDIGSLGPDIGSFSPDILSLGPDIGSLGITRFVHI